MVVVRTAKAVAGIEALRAAGRERLADRAEDVLRRLESNPRAHRSVGIQVTADDGGFGWARSEEFGGDVCVVAWVVEDGDVVVLDVNHRF